MWLSSAYFCVAIKCILSCGYQVHIFVWLSSAYFCVAIKCIFSCGYQVHTFVWLSSAYFCVAVKCILLYGYQMHTFVWLSSAYFPLLAMLTDFMHTLHHVNFGLRSSASQSLYLSYRYSSHSSLSLQSP